MMRMREAGDEVWLNTTDEVNFTNAKCEPEDDIFEHAFPATMVGTEDVKPVLPKEFPATECWATTAYSDVAIETVQGKETISLNDPITKFDDEKPVLAEQLLSYQYLEISVPSDVKSCVDDLPRRVFIKVVKESIISFEADAIVNAIDLELKSDDNLIVTAAGPKLQNELDELKNTLPQAVISEGYCVATSSYGIETCQAVFHTVVPRVSQSPTRMEEYLLRTCYLNCLAAGEENGFTKMVFPVLGSLCEDMPVFTILVALQSVLLHLQLNPNSKLRELIFVAADDRIFDLFHCKWLLGFGLISDVSRDMEFSVEAALTVRMTLERHWHHVSWQSNMRISPDPGQPFAVASFVKRWVDSEERALVQKKNDPEYYREKAERQKAKQEAKRKNLEYLREKAKEREAKRLASAAAKRLRVNKNRRERRSINLEYYREKERLDRQRKAERNKAREAVSVTDLHSVAEGPTEQLRVNYSTSK